MNSTNYSFESIVKDYCRLKGIKLISSDYFSVDLIMTNMDSLVEDEFFSYRMITQSFDDINKLPKLFILQDNDEKHYLIERVNNNFISLRHHKSISLDNILNKKITYAYMELKTFNSDYITQSLIKRTPWVGLLGVFLIFFALLIPLYSNLFNSRLIHSDSFTSVLYITFIFIFFVVAEVILRSLIYKWRSKVIHSNQMFFDDFILFNLDRYKSKSIVSDWRTIERSTNILWEGITQIVVEISTVLLFVIVVIFLTGPYGLILFSYYIIFIFFGLWVRFRAYKNSLETYKFETDKLLETISFVANKDNLKFSNVSFFRERFHMLNKKNETNKHSMSIENSRWTEIVRANTFVSLMIMFICAYLAIKTDTLVITATIALMIINGRMSGSIINAINITYNILSNWHHAKKSLELLFDKQFDRSNTTISIDRLTDLSIQRLNFKVNEFEVLQDFNASYKPGDVIGVIGPVGAGKTTLLNIICGKKEISDGSILYNGVNVGEIAEIFFNQKVAFYKPGINMIRGNLATNFNLNYVFNEQDMIHILRMINPRLNISHDLIYKMDVEDIPLSNGEKQKLLLHMMIAKKPELILLDEPTSFLSQDEAHSIVEYIVKNNPQAIIIIATHDTSLYIFMKQLIHLSKITKTATGGVHIEVPPIKFN